MKFDTELCRLAFKYGSDKCPQITHSYTPFYHLLFNNKRDSVQKLLEIGVGSKDISNFPDYVDGASLYMWRDYFPKAQIYGIDIIPKLVFKKGRIQTFLCDQANPAQLTGLIERIGSDIDIVIDDGSHQVRDMLTSFQTLMPLLKKDVVYVIEDANRNKVPTIVENLKNYDYHIMRRSRMKKSDDRLIVVKNK